MPVPKRKRSRVRRDKRFANKGIMPKIASICKTCSAPIASHIVCTECGCYKGIKVIQTKNERAEKRSIILQAKDNALNRKNAANADESSQITDNAE